MALSDTVNDWVEAYCAIRLSPTAETEVHVGAFTSITSWGPLEAAPTIVIRDGDTLVEDVDFIWTEEGQLWPLRAFDPAIWELAYTAGYTAVPAGLTSAIAELLAALTAATGFTSERLGDYAYTVGIEDKWQDVRLIETYRRLFI